MGENSLRKREGCYLYRPVRQGYFNSSVREGRLSEISVELALSDQFLGWIFALGDGVEILGSESVVKEYREELKRNLKKYK